MKMNIGGAVLGSVLLISSVTIAQTREGGSQESLRGLRSVFVSVHQNGPAEGGRGLTDSQIWSEIVLRLQIAGLNILTENEWAKTRGRPYLYLNLTDTSLAGQGRNSVGYVCTCSLDLMQEAGLARDPKTIVDACTWSRGATVVDPTADLLHLRMLIDNLASQFGSAVLAANKKVAQRTALPYPLEMH